EDRDPGDEDDESEEDEGLLAIAQDQVDRAAADEEKEHRLGEDAARDVDEAAAFARRKLVRPVGREAPLRLRLGQARGGWRQGWAFIVHSVLAGASSRTAPRPRRWAACRLPRWRTTRPSTFPRAFAVPRSPRARDLLPRVGRQGETMKKILVAL